MQCIPQPFPPPSLPSTEPSGPRHLGPPSRLPTPSSSSNGNAKPRSAGSGSRHLKPTFTTCLSYPEAMPTTFAGLNQHEVSDLQRSQRRSKVEALTKLDRAGTPVQLTSIPTATSFIPAAQPSAVPAGPDQSKNPLQRPPVVNPSFSLDTVRTEAPRHPPARSGSRLFGLEECPVFYPNVDEFRDPMAYIDSIGPIAKPYGICKIIPPQGWRMPFSLETDTFRFQTRLQRLNSLEAASRAKVNFLEQLTMFHLQQGDSKVTIPVINRKPIDLWRLRKEVNKAGGYEGVNRLKGWPVITETLGLHPSYSPNIRSAYAKIILPFDSFKVRAKYMSGSPLTPIPGTAMSKPPGFASESPVSPIQRGRMSGMRSTPTTRTVSDVHRKSQSPTPSGTGFVVSISSLRFPPSEMQFQLIQDAPTVPVKRIRIAGFSSRDGSESELSDEELSPPKKQAKRSPMPEVYQKGETCEICGGGHAAEKILLCDGCDRGFHIYCLDPPLNSVPTNEEWYCTPCLLSQGDKFGFEEGEEHSIPSFQARDAAFANAWWDKHRPAASSTGSASLSRTLGKSTVTEDDVEREFWRLTESSSETVEIEYGADVHSTTHGSAAPTLETHPLEPYAAEGWNLNNMPILPNSLLRYIKSDISGMTVPWIYIGMLFSTFCWHNEDHYTYSINYMYWGETKTWYGIPGADSDKFENAIKSEAPELFEQQPGLLYQLVTMMNPGRLSESGVKVVACDQRPNEFVITYPKAYHCGFNHGINFNEAVNFALPDWLPDGKECVTRYKDHRKPAVFSHSELLITITLYSETIKTALWLKDSLAEMVGVETARRDQLRAVVPILSETLVEEDCPEDQYQCCVCKGYCYLSQITCTCMKAVACIEHADQLCACPSSRRTLRKRYSENQLEEILAAVVMRASQPEAWRDRLRGLLFVPRPPLKSMRALLADGEKIASCLPELDDLRTLVVRANAWVDRVTILATRKSTGRRKKDRQDESTEELDRSPEVLSQLLRQADLYAFDTPEIMELRRTVNDIHRFRRDAAVLLSRTENDLDAGDCETALILGKSLNIELPEIEQLQLIVNRLAWHRKVACEVDDRTMDYREVLTLLAEAERYHISQKHEDVIELGRRRDQGVTWKKQAEAVSAAPRITIEQISNLVDGQEMIPTDVDLMREFESVRKTALNWQSSAKQQLAGGTITGAQRLYKSVTSAQGLLSRILIPEIAQVQTELEFHALWLKELSTVLQVQPTKVSSFLTSCLATTKLLLSPEDDWPVPSSESFSCFCRTPPAPIMATCHDCKGRYHPKCVGITPKNAIHSIRCGMCLCEDEDDRPSLHAIAGFADSNKWNFLIVPAEFDTISDIVNHGVRFASIVVDLIGATGQSTPCDIELLRHCARKLRFLHVTLDAVERANNQRVIFADWLQFRIQEEQTPPKARPRARKPKLILKEASGHEHTFHCLCSTQPEDHHIVVECMRCHQVYHASCVRAPKGAAAQDGDKWRCPCCTVKEGKHYKGIEVRVQMTERLGTDIFIDYRGTINRFSETLIEGQLPKSDCIILECIGFVPRFLPDADGTPAISIPRRDANQEPVKKKRRVKAAVAKIEVPDVAEANGFPPASSANGGSSAHSLAAPEDKCRPSPPKQPPVSRSVPEQRGEIATPKQASHHLFGVPSRPIPSVSTPYTPQSSWRPFATPHRPALTAMTDAHGNSRPGNGLGTAQGMIPNRSSGVPQRGSIVG